MTTAEFLALGGPERNEIVARALGWKTGNGKHCWPHTTCYHQPGGSPRHLDAICLPNWTGDDGVAFEQVWPEIYKLGTRADKSVDFIALRQTPRGFHFHVYRCELGQMWTLDLPTAALAICIAFLKLKGVIE